MPLHVTVRSMTRNRDKHKENVEPEEELDSNRSMSAGAISMRHLRKKRKRTDTDGQYKEDERIRSKARRDKSSDQQKVRNSETSKLRMRKRRNLKKLEAAEQATKRVASGKIPPPPVKKRITKAERTYNRVKKTESRANRSKQKIRRDNEKNKNRMQAKRAEEKRIREELKAKKEELKEKRAEQKRLKAEREARRSSGIFTPENSTNGPGNQGQGLMTPKGLFKCLRQVKNDLRTIGKTKNPRIAFVNSITKRLKAKYPFATRLHFRNHLQVSSKEYTSSKSPTGQSTERKQRSDALHIDTITDVNLFYQRPDNCHELPDKKTANDRRNTAQRVAQRSLKGLHEKWIEEKPNSPISFSKFASLHKDAGVKTQDKMPHYQCLCEYCANIDLKLKALRAISSQQKVTAVNEIVKDRYAVINATMCQKDGRHHKMECIRRECRDCGTILLKDPFNNLDQSMETTWNAWEYRESHLTKNKRRVIVRKTGIVKDVMDGLAVELEPFAKHLFVAQWQHDQFTAVTSNIPQDTAILVMDYSENFTTFAQYEIQSAHWCKQVVTLHPVVAYYTCPEHGTMVREAIHIVSDDNTHDAHAVAAFVDQVTEHLRVKRGLTLKRQIQFTDGAASQYKSKTPFADLSFGVEDHGLTIERHFFGSRHGKGPSDGEGGVVKSGATRAIKNEQMMITDAASFQMFGEDLMTKEQHVNDKCVHPRTFYLVPSSSIQRNRPERDALTVQGTRQLHAVRGVQKGHLLTRELSCFCTNCEEGEYEACCNADYVKPYKQVALKFKKLPEATVDVQPERVEEATVDEQMVIDEVAMVGEVGVTENRGEIASGTTNGHTTGGQMGLTEGGHTEEMTETEHIQTGDEEAGTSTEQISNDDVAGGEYVAVKFSQTGRKSSASITTVVYMAIVLEKVEDGLQLKFLRRVERDTGSFYIFPDKEKPFTHPASDILCKVNPPSLRNQRSGNQYMFTHEDLQRVAASVRGKIYLK